MLLLNLYYSHTNKDYLVPSLSVIITCSSNGTLKLWRKRHKAWIQTCYSKASKKGHNISYS